MQSFRPPRWLSFSLFLGGQPVFLHPHSLNDVFFVVVARIKQKSKAESGFCRYDQGACA